MVGYEKGTSHVKVSKVVEKKIGEVDAKGHFLYDLIVWYVGSFPHDYSMMIFFSSPKTTILRARERGKDLTPRGKK